MSSSEGPNPGVAQFAFSVSDLPRAAQLYCDVLGCAKASGLPIWGNFLATLQRVPDPAAALWWIIDRQDFVQMELWGYTGPIPRALARDWRPSDIGYTRSALHVDDFDAALGRLGEVGLTTLSPPQGPAGDRRVCIRDQDGFIIEVLERDPLPDARPPRWPQASCAIRSVSLSVPDLEKARRFWVETLEVPEVEPSLLHTPEMEALWALPGRGSARIDRCPSARGRHSIRPLNTPTTLPSARSSATQHAVRETSRSTMWSGGPRCQPRGSSHDRAAGLTVMRIRPLVYSRRTWEIDDRRMRCRDRIGRPIASVRPLGSKDSADCVAYSVTPPAEWAAPLAASGFMRQGRKPCRGRHRHWSSVARAARGRGWWQRSRVPPATTWVLIPIPRLTREI